jgi:hypothetical protein
LALVIAVEGIPVWGALPVIAGELVALALLSLVRPLEAEQGDRSYSASM